MTAQTSIIRSEFVTFFESIANLGGDDPTPSNRKIHKYAYDSDDVEEAKAYWETTVGGAKVINGIMITRINRNDEEPHASGAVREFKNVHSFKFIFRYAKEDDPLAEQAFEAILDAILDGLQNNEVFDRGGRTPQPFGIEAGRADIVNKPIFHLRVWEAEIFVDIVEHVDVVPSS